MGNIVKKIKGTTDFIEYQLETDLIDPPVLRVKLEFRTTADLLEAANGGVVVPPLGVLQIAKDAISAWDLTLDGKPMPLTEENKRLYLEDLLSCEVKGRESAKGPAVTLGIAIYEDCQKRELFLKN